MHVIIAYASIRACPRITNTRRVSNTLIQIDLLCLVQTITPRIAFHHDSQCSVSDLPSKCSRIGVTCGLNFVGDKAGFNTKLRNIALLGVRHF